MGDINRKLGDARTKVGRCPFSLPPMSTVAMTTSQVQWLTGSHGSHWAYNCPSHSPFRPGGWLVYLNLTRPSYPFCEYALWPPSPGPSFAAVSVPSHEVLCPTAGAPSMLLPQSLVFALPPLAASRICLEHSPGFPNTTRKGHVHPQFCPLPIPSSLHPSLFFIETNNLKISDWQRQMITYGTVTCQEAESVPIF